MVSSPVRSQYTTARLFVADGRVVPGDFFYVGLELETAPEWHTYWENPGDSGLATAIHWQLPPGFSAGPILWPTPRRIFIAPLMSFGYGSDDPKTKGRVTLLTRVDVALDAKPGPVRLAASVEWLECKEICLPGEGSLQLNARLDAIDSRSNETRRDRVVSEYKANSLIEQALVKLPRGLLERSPLPPIQLRAEIAEDSIRLEISAIPSGFPGTDNARQMYFFAETEGMAAHAEPQAIEISGDRIRIRIPRDLAANQLPEGEVRGVLRLATPEVDANNASVVDEAWYIRAPLKDEGVFQASGAILAMFALAMIGGMLLNLMPCVLPVLSLKVLALIEGGQRDASSPASRRDRMLAGGTFSAGVIVTFLTLAGVLLLLQAAGAAVGWGYQLQSPGFVLVLLMIVSAFALNLLGVYEISVQAINWVPANLLRGQSSHFAAGVLATVLATPCTAPFMGTAMGFAFTQGAAIVLLIFFALGLGMSLPYLIFAAFPAALAWLPKPGRWMESLKQFTGFMLLATTLWLLWIFGRLAGPDAQILAIATTLALGIAAWIYGRWFSGVASTGVSGDLKKTGRGRLAAIVALLASLIFALGLGWSALSTETDANTKTKADGLHSDWQIYSPERVAELRAQGRSVFIDFTADWCLSCKVNEALTFRSEAVWRRMRELDVTAFQADWTRQDPVITKALREYGRSGVPLYVLYGPDAATPARLLPEVLSESLFLAELEKLDSPSRPR